MTKLAYILFSNRSEDTGKDLFAELSRRNAGGYDWRWTKGSPKQTPSLVLRWGNSYQAISGSHHEINSKEGLMIAANKFRMAEALHQDADVNFLDVVFDLKDEEALSAIADENGKAFIRSSVGREQPVRYDLVTNIKYGDVYATKNTEKVEEYRVHVLNDTIICVFLKEPYKPSETLIYKNNNCKFRKVDDITYGKSSKAEKIRKQAIAATRACKLTTSGVDVMVLADGSIVVNEVNSAPGINTPGIERWCDAIEDYIEQFNLQVTEEE